MNNEQSRRRQRGVSMWTVSGSVLIAAGVAGISVALIKPGGQAAAVTPVASKGSGTAAGASAAQPAAPGAAPTPKLSAAAPAPLTKPAVPGAGPHTNWHGTWQGEPPGTPLVITSTRFGACKWVESPDPNFAGECQAGYAPTSMPLAEIARSFDESVAQFQNTPNPVSAGDATRARELIGRMKPGNYRVVLMFDGTDCTLTKMIIDGDLLLRIVNCGYRQQISLLTRAGAAPPAVAQGGQSSKDAGGADPAGRWQGTLIQAGYAPYPAVMQLQLAAGTPSGTMAYPSLGCTGSLAFVRRDGSMLWFRESIQEGRGKCMDGGLISVSALPNDTVHWQYFAPGNTSMPIAVAQLRR